MIEITQETIDRVSVILSGVPAQVPKVFTRAINRSLGTVKAEVYRGVTNRYALTRSTIKDYTKDRIIKASNSNICGIVEFSGVRIPLYKYTTTTPKKSVRGVLVQSGQMYRQTFEHAFIATMHNPKEKNHIGIFEREGKARYPIKELLGSSMSAMASNTIVIDKAYAKGKAMLDKRIEHEIDRILNG